ncbi:hypothetical protein LWC34_02130 [Kibdelosporangium philippinense]|uniref:Uncharacterized protein n=1 Tax=Kibdelosporangium philippinense TaxID=211113 RepID=A0ABS8Z3Z3_9PSEU|nr:hypothetical protein [Kibdelosporangium philippinense]
MARDLVQVPARLSRPVFLDVEVEAFSLARVAAVRPPQGDLVVSVAAMMQVAAVVKASLRPNMARIQAGTCHRQRKVVACRSVRASLEAVVYLRVVKQPGSVVACRSVRASLEAVVYLRVVKQPGSVVACLG